MSAVRRVLACFWFFGRGWGFRGMTSPSWPSSCCSVRSFPVLFRSSSLSLWGMVRVRGTVGFSVPRDCRLGLLVFQGIVCGVSRRVWGPFWVLGCVGRFCWDSGFWGLPVASLGVQCSRKRFRASSLHGVVAGCGTGGLPGGFGDFVDIPERIPRMSLCRSV